jgi:hypothetical protein
MRLWQGAHTVQRATFLHLLSSRIFIRMAESSFYLSRSRGLLKIWQDDSGHLLLDEFSPHYFSIVIDEVPGHLTAHCNFYNSLKILRTLTWNKIIFLQEKYIFTQHWPVSLRMIYNLSKSSGMYTIQDIKGTVKQDQLLLEVMQLEGLTSGHKYYAVLRI